MASAIIHISVAKKINEILHMNEKELFLGTIAPDISKQIGESKDKSHFLFGSDDNIPKIDKFIEKYKMSLSTPFNMGYLIHLYTDYYWFKNFVSKFSNEDHLNLLDKITIDVNDNTKNMLIYNDYTNINTDLIDYYSLDLSLFYEELEYPHTNIDEIPIDKLKLVVDKMGMIITEANTNKNYVFDKKMIIAFVEGSTVNILNNLKALNII